MIVRKLWEKGAVALWRTTDWPQPGAKSLVLTDDGGLVAVFRAGHLLALLAGLALVTLVGWP